MFSAQRHGGLDPMFCFSSIFNNNAQTTVHQEQHRNKCFELFTGRKYTLPNDTHPYHKQNTLRWCVNTYEYLLKHIH